jgi:hypothetical protein
MVQIRELTVGDPAFGAWHDAIRDAHLAGREPDELVAERARMRTQSRTCRPVS